MIKIVKKYSPIADIVFKAAYLLFAFATYCNLTYARPIMSLFVDAVLGLGAIVAVMRLIQIKSYWKNPALIFLGLFLVSYAFSSVMNYRYGYADNFKYLIWTVFHFALLFAYRTDSDGKTEKRELHLMTWVFLLFSFVMSTASLVQFLRGYTAIQYFPDRSPFLAGFVWGRLWGVFYDPNYAAVFATMSALFSVYHFRAHKNLVLRIALAINILIQFFYIAFSDSRTGLVTLFATFFIYFLVLSVNRYSLKNAYMHVAVLVAAVVIAALPLGIKYGYNEVKANINAAQTQTTEPTENVVTEPSQPTPTEPTTVHSPITVPEDPIGREDDLKDDITNRRFDLWKSAIEVFRSSPLYGTSFFNLKAYTEDRLPNTYLINNDSGAFSNFHNMLFNVLAGQGLFGILVILAFVIYILIRCWKPVFHAPKEADVSNVALLLGILACSFSSAMFLTDITYVNSPTAFFFWTCLGYLLQYAANVKNGRLSSAH